MASTEKRISQSSQAQPRPARKITPERQTWFQKLVARLTKGTRTSRRVKKTASVVLHAEPKIQNFVEETRLFETRFQPFGVVTDALKASPYFAPAVPHLDVVMAICSDFQAAFAQQDIEVGFVLTLREREDRASITLLVQPSSSRADVYGLSFELAGRYAEQIGRIKPHFAVVADHSKRKEKSLA